MKIQMVIGQGGGEWESYEYNVKAGADETDAELFVIELSDKINAMQNMANESDKIKGKGNAVLFWNTPEYQQLQEELEKLDESADMGKSYYVQEYEVN